MQASVTLTSIIIFGGKKILNDRRERCFFSKGFKQNINEMWLSLHWRVLTA